MFASRRVMGRHSGRRADNNLQSLESMRAKSKTRNPSRPQSFARYSPDFRQFWSYFVPFDLLGQRPSEELIGGFGIVARPQWASDMTGDRDRLAAPLTGDGCAWLASDMDVVPRVRIFGVLAQRVP